MAFTPDTLSVIVQPIGGGGMRFLSYQTDDAAATVTASDYFANAESYGVRAHDLIFVSPVDGAVEPYILVVDSVDADGNATASVDTVAIADVVGLQAALDAKQPLDADLTALAALTTAAYGRGLLEYTSEAALKAGVNLEIGTDVQAYSANLTTLAEVTASPTLATRAAAEAFAPATAPDFIRTAGYTSAGDGGGALYKKVSAEPAHAGKFSITLSDAVTVVWYEIADVEFSVKAFGAKGDTASVAVTASITAATNTLTATGAAFTAADVGKLINVPGAGAAGVTLGTTIATYVSATEVTLTDNASTTLASAAVTIDYGTDDTVAMQAAHVFAASRTIFYPPGTYMTTKAILTYSETTIRGLYGASKIMPAAKYTGTASYDGACFLNATFASATALTDHDIVVEDMLFDFVASQAAGSSRQRVGVFMRYVERVKVIRCIQYDGGDLTGLLRCKDTQTSDCVAYDIRNCAYDHWSSTGYVIVSNCITRSTTVAPNQCIQVTGDDTTPGSPTLLGTGHVEKIVIEGNIIDVIADGTVAGIIINCLDPGASAQDVVIANNYVRGPNYGVAIEGNVDGFVINGNVLRGIVTQGILVLDGGNGVPFPNDGVISNNVVIDAGAIGIDIDHGTKIIISGNRVSAPGTWSIRLQADASGCHVHGNMVDAGTSGTISNLGTNNIVSTPETVQARYAATNIFSGAAAPTAWTALDCSSVVGAYRALVYARVTNASGSAAKYVFRTNGDSSVENTLTTINTGANVCEMQNTEQQYVTFVTDASGIAEWASSVGAGTTTVTIIGYQRLL
jgi:hypothetical protein